MNGKIELVDIQVGKKFPLFPESVEQLKGQDGAFLESNEFNQGLMFCIHLTNIQFMDKLSFRESKVQMRTLQGDHGMILPMVKFGKELLFEMSFDPTLYEDDRAFQIVDKNNLLTMFLIESNTGELKAIRQCNLPLKMIQICREAWGRAMLDVNFSEKFSTWRHKLANYPLETLWSRATKVGELGETYDLQDIKIPNQYKPQSDL